MSIPGDVHFLPPDPSEGPAKGARPHVVVSLRAPGPAVVTLAWGSSRETEAVQGAAHVLVDPRGTRYGRTGLARPTYFYPSRLVGVAGEDLPPAAGRLVRELPELVRRLRLAVGLGTGVTREPNVPGANRRGRIARYAPWLGEELGTDTCLVVTEPAYSRTCRYQLTVPLLAAEEFERSPGDVDVRWSREGARTGRGGFAAVPLVFSVFEKTHLRGYTGEIVDAESMRAVDVALTRHLGL